MASYAATAKAFVYGRFGALFWWGELGMCGASEAVTGLMAGVQLVILFLFAKPRVLQVRALCMVHVQTPRGKSVFAPMPWGGTILLLTL